MDGCFRSRAFVRLAATLVAFVYLILSPVAHAAVFDATNAAELASALDAADTNGEDDTINIAAGTYDATGVGGFVYDGSAEDFSLTLVGAGSDMAIIDGGQSVRPLGIDSIGSVSVTGITFHNGDADQSGGGLRVTTTTGNILIDSCGFRDNSTPIYGGGAYLESDQGDVEIRNSGFSGGSGQDGGGVLGRSADGGVTLLGNVFVSNECTNTGGGGYAYAPGEGAILVANNLAVANVALGANSIGGGIYAEAAFGDITAYNNTIYGNRAEAMLTAGAGLYLNGPNFLVVNNTITGNVAVGAGGGLLMEDQGGRAELYNNIIRGNTAGGDGADIHSGNHDPYIVNNNNYGELFTSGAVTSQANNIDLDSLFVDITNNDPIDWDLHLQDTSPCVDSGDNNEVPAAATTDRDGDPRIFDGTFNGTATVDMGSDEYFIVRVPGIAVSPTVLDFGTSPGDRVVTVTNQGNGNLLLGTVGGTDALAAPFSLGADTCSDQTLAPDGTCSITVTYAPTPIISGAASLGGLSLALLFMIGFGAWGGRHRLSLWPGFVVAVLFFAAAGVVACGDEAGPASPEPLVHTDSFDIPSDDPNTASVTVSVTGTELP